jgi:mRNA-degrading endonuclease toxin of MazEF toxin-antitoxin module
MKPFEIFNWHPPHWDKPHPAVIVSHSSRAGNKDLIEVVMCTSQRASRGPKPEEIVLDEADGLDWPTLCRCDLIYAVPREDLKGRRGKVSAARQSQLVRTLIAAHGWAFV